MVGLCRTKPTVTYIFGFILQKPTVTYIFGFILQIPVFFVAKVRQNKQQISLNFPIVSCHKLLTVMIIYKCGEITSGDTSSSRFSQLIWTNLFYTLHRWNLHILDAIICSSFWNRKALLITMILVSNLE